jgi:transcriptional regulator with XRE-family HTH domain
MGLAARDRPERLADKIYEIRLGLGLTQAQMRERLGIDYHVAYISLWETGKSEPPLRVLLAYARLAGVWVDVLIDDALDVPPIEPVSPPQRQKGRRGQKSQPPPARQKRRTFLRRR